MDVRRVNHGGNTTIVGAIRRDGPVCMRSFHGAMNAARFTAFVKSALAPRLRPGDIVVLDNLSSHWSKPAIGAIEARGAYALFLPPYSPDMNPIELVWPVVKRYLRRVAAGTTDVLRAALRIAWRRASHLNYDNLLRACGYL